MIQLATDRRWKVSPCLQWVLLLPWLLLWLLFSQSRILRGASLSLCCAQWTENPWTIKFGISQWRLRQCIIPPKVPILLAYTDCLGNFLYSVGNYFIAILGIKVKSLYDPVLSRKQNLRELSLNAISILTICMRLEIRERQFSPFFVN